jgi:Tfp pilus assembly protein PilO
VCGGYFFYIDPAYTEVKDLMAKKDQYTDILNKTKQIKQRRDALNSSYQSISEENRDRLNKMIPAEFNQILFLNDVTTLAKKQGVTLQDVTINGVQTEQAGSAIIIGQAQKPYKTITVTFKVKATYPQFKQFLKSVESSLRLMDVINLSVAPDAKSFNAPAVYSIEINTYSL